MEAAARIIQTHQSELLDRIHLTGTLWHHLVCSGVTSLAEAAHLQDSKGDGSDRAVVKLILEKVAREGPITYQAFRKAVINSGQKDLVRQCLPDIDSSLVSSAFPSDPVPGLPTREAPESSADIQNTSREPGTVHVKTKVQHQKTFEQCKELVDLQQLYRNVLRGRSENTDAAGDRIRHKRQHLQLYKMQKLLEAFATIKELVMVDGYLLWILVPCSFERLCHLENFSISHMHDIQRALEDDVKEFTAFSDGCLFAEVIIDAKPCKAELLLGEPFLSAAVAFWEASKLSQRTPNLTCSWNHCVSVVFHLSEHGLVPASSYIEKYLECYKPHILKLAQVAILQYIKINKRDLQVEAERMEQCLIHTDLKDLAALFTVDIAFANEQLRAWLAAYYVINTGRYELVQHETVHSFLSAKSLHQCLIYFDEHYSQRLPLTLGFDGLTSFDTKTLIADFFKDIFYRPVHDSQDLIHFVFNDELPKEGSIREQAPGDGVHIVKLMAKLANCKVWSLVNMGLHKGDLSDMLATEGKESIQIDTLLLSFNNLNHGGAALGGLMKALPGCRGINLCATGLFERELWDIVSTLGGSQLATRELILYKNDLSGAGSELGQLMVAMPCCRQWDFSMTQLQGDDVNDMADALREARLKVEVLCFSGLDLSESGSGIGRLISASPHCKHVDLSHCQVKKVDLAAMVDVLQDKRLEVSQMYLQGNELTGAGQMVGQLMVMMPHCKLWDLRSSGLGAQDIKDMVGAIKSGHCVTLECEKMDLEGNNLAGGGLYLGELMLLLPCCKSWDMSWDELMSQDIVNMAECLKESTLKAVREVNMEGNPIGGGALGLAKLMVALSECRIWNLGATELETENLRKMSRAVGDVVLKVEQLILDGPKEFYTDEDTEIFSHIMPGCSVQYNHQSRGHISRPGELRENCVPELELTVTAQQYKAGSPGALFGLADGGCLMSSRKSDIVRLDQHGRVAYWPYRLDKPVVSFTAYESTLFLLHENSVTRITNYDQVINSASADAWKSVRKSSKSPKRQHFNFVGMCESCRAATAKDANTLLMIESSRATFVLELHLETSTVKIVYRNLDHGNPLHMVGFRTPPTLVRHGKGPSVLYLINAEDFGYISVSTADWNRETRVYFKSGRQDGQLYVARSFAVTPVDTIVVADTGNYRVSEFTLRGRFIRHLLTDLESAPVTLAIVGYHMWVLCHDSTVRRYTLYVPPPGEDGF